MVKRFSILLLFFGLGLLSFAFQTLIVREFIIAFGGTELAIALFFFFWLFWVGAGSFLASKLPEEFLTRHFIKTLFIYPLAACAQIVLFFNLRPIAGVNSWELFTYAKVLPFVFIFTALISGFTGIIFTSGSLWLNQEGKAEAGKAITLAYSVEALGSFLAGILVTLFFIKSAGPAIIAVGACLFFTFSIIFLSLVFRKKISLAVAVAAALIFLSGAVKISKIDSGLSSCRLSWLKGAKFQKEVYTPYQHLFIVSRQNQTVVFSDGQILTAIPEDIDSEKDAALLMAQAKLPKNILVFGYGAENLIRTLLKFSVTSVTYCFPDRGYYEAVAAANLKPDARLHLEVISPRLFLKNNTVKFDLAIVHTPDPSSLAINSFFTGEFYALLKNSLAAAGVLATRVTGAEDYAGSERRNYGSSIYYTLKNTFDDIVIIPGETNWIFASPEKNLLTDDPLILAGRLKEFIPPGFSFLPDNFSRSLAPERAEFTRSLYIDNPLFKGRGLINRDNKPLTFFLNLLVLGRYENSPFSGVVRDIFYRGISLVVIPVVIFFLARLAFLFSCGHRRIRRLNFHAKLFQFLSGFLGFSSHLILIFLFQNSFGNIFELIGLVNSLFMLGLFAGAIFGASLVKKFKPSNAVSIVLIAQALLILIIYPLTHFYSAGQIIFFVLFLSIGAATGASYPLCAAILQANKITLQKTAASLELFDHLGGALAALAAGLLFLPVWGTAKTIGLLFGINFLLLVIFILESFGVFRKEKDETGKTNFMAGIIYLLIAAAVSYGLILLFFPAGNAAKVPGQEKCFSQEIPFKAMVCESGAGREYLIETKDIAPEIKGFGGPINVQMRIKDDGAIKEIKVLEHNETSSYLGGLADFLKQFIGKKMNRNFSRENIDVITGATITSQAIIDIVNKTAERVRVQTEGRRTREEGRGKKEEKESKIDNRQSGTETGRLEKVDTGKIKAMVKDKRLSDKEAMFYHNIGDGK